MNLKDVLCPSLIVCGEKDNANKKAAIHLSQNIPNAEIKLMKDAGHELNIDAPESKWVNVKIIQHFLYRYL